MAATDVQRAYPRLPEFWALKRRLDPGGKFANTFIDEFISGREATSDLRHR